MGVGSLGQMVPSSAGTRGAAESVLEALGGRSERTEGLATSDPSDGRRLSVLSVWDGGSSLLDTRGPEALEAAPELGGCWAAFTFHWLGICHLPPLSQ